MLKGLNVVCPHSVLSLNVYVLDYSEVNSLCSSAISIPWFLMNYKGRVLQRVTDRVVSYKNLFSLCPWLFCTSLSQYFITFWSQTLSVFPPGTLTQPTPESSLFIYFFVLSMSYLIHLHCRVFQESARLMDLIAIRKLSWSWIVAWFKFRSDGIFVWSLHR